MATPMKDPLSLARVALDQAGQSMYARDFLEAENRCRAALDCLKQTDDLGSDEGRLSAIDRLIALLAICVRLQRGDVAAAAASYDEAVSLRMRVLFTGE